MQHNIDAARNMKKLLNSMKVHRENNVIGDKLKELLTYIKIQSQSLGKRICTLNVILLILHHQSMIHDFCV